jgi:hypothetical protein
MATHIRDVRCGNKTYYLSINAQDVYFSSTSKSGGLSLKGIKNYHNELRNTSNNKAASDFDLCQAIRNSL